MMRALGFAALAVAVVLLALPIVSTMSAAEFWAILWALVVVAFIVIAPGAFFMLKQAR